jgi:hypothetical protein
VDDGSSVLVLKVVVNDPSAAIAAIWEAPFKLTFTSSVLGGITEAAVIFPPRATEAVPNETD